MAANTPSNRATVGLFPRRLKKRSDTRYFTWDFLQLWRIGASGALTWFLLGLGVSWAVSLFAQLETAEFVLYYLFVPIALWFVALGIGSLAARGMVVAYVGPDGVGLAWGPVFFRKRVLLPFGAIERVIVTRWERQLNPDAVGTAGKTPLAQKVEGFSPRFVLREPIEIDHLVQLPKFSERYSAKKPLVVTDDGMQLWMYRRLKGGYAPFAAALAQYVTVEGELSQEPPPTKWERSDWLLSVFLSFELAWIASRFFR